MSDNTKLKRLAEAANAVIGDVSVDITISSERGPNQPEIDAVTAFVGAATPAVVLALIAENERLEAINNQMILLECNGGTAQAAINLLEERDQLRAEVAGLRTGYEAYEQVNAELKAENQRLRSGMKGDYDLDAWLDWTQEAEGLRKDAERYRWLLQNWFTMSSEYMGGVSFQTGRSRWSDLPDEAVSEAIDAALGQGEQS